MLTLRTILHPTDFSDSSRCALEMACSLARDHGARVVLVHVAPPPQLVSYEGMPVVPALPVGYQDELRGRLQQFAANITDVPVETRLEAGFAVPEILRTAREVNCDLIVMGTHGRSGLGRLLLGSVAEQVLRKAPCPVLTVKGPTPQPNASEPAVAESVS